MATRKTCNATRKLCHSQQDAIVECARLNKRHDNFVCVLGLLGRHSSARKQFRFEVHQCRGSDHWHVRLQCTFVTLRGTPSRTPFSLTRCPATAGEKVCHATFDIASTELQRMKRRRAVRENLLDPLEVYKCFAAEGHHHIGRRSQRREDCARRIQVALRSQLRNRKRVMSGGNGGDGGAIPPGMEIMGKGVVGGQPSNVYQGLKYVQVHTPQRLKLQSWQGRGYCVDTTMSSRYSASSPGGGGSGGGYVVVGINTKEPKPGYLCKICLVSGHYMNDCAGYRCKLCGERGHAMEDCRQFQYQLVTECEHCDGKAIHETKQIAQTECDRMVGAGKAGVNAHKLVPYKCPKGRRWHAGHKH